MSSIAIRWRELVTEHDGIIDDPDWKERGRPQVGKPWIDSKAWAVARVLDDHMDKNGICWPSFARIAKQARISRSSAKDGVDRLVGAGLLEVKQRRFAANYSDSNVFRALGVGPERPEGRAGGSKGSGRRGPQSTHEVSDSPDGSSPKGNGNAASQAGEPRTCFRCGNPTEPNFSVCTECIERENEARAKRDHARRFIRDGAGT